MTVTDLRVSRSNGRRSFARSMQSGHTTFSVSHLPGEPSQDDDMEAQIEELWAFARQQQAGSEAVPETPEQAAERHADIALVIALQFHSAAWQRD